MDVQFDDVKAETSSVEGEVLHGDIQNEGDNVPHHEIISNPCDINAASLQIPSNNNPINFNIAGNINLITRNVQDSISSGVVEFDEMLGGGGFKRGVLEIICGTPGLSTISTAFTLFGTHYDERSLILVLNDNEGFEMLSLMSHKCNISNDILKGPILHIETEKNFLSRLDHVKSEMKSSAFKFIIAVVTVVVSYEGNDVVLKEHGNSNVFDVVKYLSEIVSHSYRQTTSILVIQMKSEYGGTIHPSRGEKALRHLLNACSATRGVLIDCPTLQNSDTAGPRLFTLFNNDNRLACAWNILLATNIGLMSSIMPNEY